MEFKGYGHGGRAGRASDVRRDSRPSLVAATFQS
jgi:hypothetical protein